MSWPVPKKGRPPRKEGIRYFLFGYRGWYEAFWSDYWKRWVNGGRINTDGYPENGLVQIYMPDEVEAYMETGRRPRWPGDGMS